MFWVIMIPMLCLIVLAIIIGEERVNGWFDQLRCSHDYKVRSSYLNKNEVSVCQKCGRKEIIKEEE